MKTRILCATSFCLVMLLLPHATSAADWTPTTLPSAGSESAQPVWYRCYVRVPASMVTPQEKDLFRDSVTLNFGGIDGAFTVYLNGQKIIEADQARNSVRRRFKVPKEILQKEAFNCIAIQLSPAATAKGIGTPPMFAGYFDELLLTSWELARQAVEPTSLTSVKDQPPTASYTEQGFHPATSALGRNPDLIPGVRIPPAQSLGMIKVNDDLVVDLIESEPVVAQPTHISFDERGRMWVAQYRQYPYPAGIRMLSRDMYYRATFDRMPPAPPNNDKGADIITVHEDTKGDGHFDQHKIVLSGLNMANAAVYGHGGIWVMNTPYLVFYPDPQGNDTPGEPQVRLAGFGLEDAHSVANGLVWGPDGWLYGGQGSTTTSRIVRPGIDPPNSPGVYWEGCMVWRYHPEKKIYEIFAEGGGNTFGLDFDAEGRIYSGHNGGITHGFYFVPQGIYLKQGVDVGKFGPAANPYIFGQLPPIKNRGPLPRFTHDIVMFEGTALPQRYVGRMFGADPLHHCLTLSERYPTGSSFETSDDDKPLTSTDPTFRPVYLVNAPDGSLYVADFCEEYIAHGQNYQGQIDPTSGRIYRLRGKDLPLNKDVNIAGRSTGELIETLKNPSRWHRQTAVRVLGARRDTGAVAPLKAHLASAQTHPALEALWALYQMGVLDETMALSAIAHPAPMVRAWTARLAGDERQLSPAVYAALLKQIAQETDAEARCQYACTARRLPASQALPIVAALLAHDADAQDPNIPLLCWWTIESHVNSDRAAVMELLDNPTAWNSAPMQQVILSRLMQRLAATGARADALDCARLLNEAPNEACRKQLVAGFGDAFKGRAMPPLPQELAKALAASGMASPLLLARLGDQTAIASELKIAGDSHATLEDRVSSVTLFGEVATPSAVPVLLDVATHQGAPALRMAALTSLMRYDDASIGRRIAGALKAFPPEVRNAAVNTLASRASWSVELLRTVENGDVKPADIQQDVATRLRTQDDSGVAAQAVRLLPERKGPAKTERMAEITRVRKIIEAGVGDPYKGEATFMSRCAICHTLFHKGGHVGPNLTSYQRDDLGTMLISIIDPSAEIREGFQNYILRTKDKRVLTGFLADNNADVVTIRGVDGQDVRVPRNEIDVLKALPQSIMPEGLLEGLEDQPLRDFFAYLRVPQPITK